MTYGLHGIASHFNRPSASLTYSFYTDGAEHAGAGSGSRTHARKGGAEQDDVHPQRAGSIAADAPASQKVIWAENIPGLCVLVSRGPKEDRRATVTFRVAYYRRDRPGKPQYITLGRYPDGEYVHSDKVIAKCSNIADMRDAASRIRKLAKDGNDPKRPTSSDVFEDVVANFIDNYAKTQTRTWAQTERLFRVYVLPEWRYRKIHEIKRRDVTALLDRIARGEIKRKVDGKVQQLGSATVADAVLAAISKLCNWYQTQEDEYTSPIVKGMKRAKPIKLRARDRVLSDQEIRLFWPILDRSGQFGIFGAAIKVMLLTAQRVHKVGEMRRSEIHETYIDPNSGKKFQNVWDAAVECPKNKRVSLVPLSQLACQIIDAVPIISDDQDLIFTVNGREPFDGWSKAKRNLDHALEIALQAEGAKFKQWQLRDLRRTARTLMSRAGISNDHAEHCLGHAMDPIRKTYDKHQYLDEKRQAFEMLANLIERIIDPDPVVVAFPTRA